MRVGSKSASRPTQAPNHCRIFKSPAPIHCRLPGKARVAVVPVLLLVPLQKRTLSCSPPLLPLKLSLLMRTSRSHGTEKPAARHSVRQAVVDGMPPLDLDAVACGDAFFDEGYGDDEEYEDPYAPAASLRLRIGEDIDWSDVVGGGGAVAAVLRRGDSTKGAGANPKSAARRSVQHAAAAAPRTKVAPVVIGGLPAGKVRCSPCRFGGRARVFAAAGEQHPAQHHHQLEEPGSPKVSCLGAVRPEQRRLAARSHGTPSRRARAWWWFAARATCCFSGHRRSAPTGSEADG